MSDQINVELLARYQPLNALNPEHLQEILKQLKLITVPANKTLFEKGSTENFQYFLVKGELNLLGDSGVLKTIKSDSNDGLNAIAHILPRTVTAQAKTDCTLFKIDGDLIDVMLTWDQTGSYQVTELGVGGAAGDDDWMSRILQTEAFHRIPPANIQAIFLRMQSVPVKAGDKIVLQDGEGDYFYIIKKGRALVARTIPNQPKAVKLAELKEGDSFGEEALISNAKRNASVTMLADGMLSRLSKTDFLKLLNEPLLDWVDYNEAQKLVDSGAQWLDVRLPAEHKANSIMGDTHIPLIFLRMKINSLDSHKKYIVYCDTGRRSSAASYLLNERGFTSYILKEGIRAAPQDKRTHE
ncbi:hypothetical protein MNBD_GAMMA08-3184 [hydrothermal vent metagenome]|uniref:Cyclic nucleotide-binding protein n=1 Tax=hydrothermal vent metagenome TaxID=652676 RepID=A0A3B0X4D1_9ZZZZ